MPVAVAEAPLERIELCVKTGDHSKTVDFKGRWLIDPASAIGVEDDEDGVRRGRAAVALAVTAKKQLAVFEVDGDDDEGELMVFPGFKELRESEAGPGVMRYPSNVLAAIADVLGETYVEELDI